MRHWRPDLTGLPSEARLHNTSGFVVFVCLRRVAIISDKIGMTQAA